MRCCWRKVDDAATHKRATIIDPHDDAPAVAFIRNAYARAKRERAVRSREAIGVNALATGGALTGIDIHGSDARLGHCHGRTTNENYCAANRGTQAHKHSTGLPDRPQ